MFFVELRSSQFSGVVCTNMLDMEDTTVYPRTWSGESGFEEEEDEWLLKTAFKQSSCPNSARMNHAFALNRASPNKENVTYLDASSDIFIGASPPATFNSPTKFVGARQMASPVLRQPLDDQDPNSQDSGYGQSEDSKSAFRFAEPCGLAPRRNSIEPSPRKELMPSPGSKICHINSPCLVYSRSLSSGAESTDDGFLDTYINDKMQDEAHLPVNISSLITGSIKSRELIPSSPDSPTVGSYQDEFVRPPLRRCQSSIDNTTPSSRRVRTSLFKQSTVVRTLETSLEGSPVTQLANSAFTTLCLSSGPSAPFKRPEPPSRGSPITKKRRRSLMSITENETSPRGTLLQYGFEKKTVKFQRSMSANEATIMSALTRSSQDPHLIGDFSKPFALPLEDGRHQDLKSISCDTLAKLIDGEYDDTIASYTIVDCRYPYEFEGGHIKGAKNFYTREQITKEFVESKTRPDDTESSKRNIIIFHCEFSSERGPALSRFLRNSDRESNKECYPTLDYPEMYLLNGGYKQFFEKHVNLCTPRSYCPMGDPKHESDLRKFRAKSKSWNGGDGKSRLAPRGSSLKRLGL